MRTLAHTGIHDLRVQARLQIKQYLPGCEIVHFASRDALITSRGNWIHYQDEQFSFDISVPGGGVRQWLGFSRLLRRILRTDKCNVVPLGAPVDALLVIREGRVYRYDFGSKHLAETLRLENCRNVLHQSISVLDGCEVVFGEYGANRERREVPVYRSTDAGRTWRRVLVFPAGKTKHVHGCYWDPIESKYWIFTGDYRGENHVVVADREFGSLEWLGDGSQTWRAVGAFFAPDRVTWIMDSQLEDSRLVTLDRQTRTILEGQTFPGPVWYVKQLADGLCLAATACERGPGVHTNSAHVFASRDLSSWAEVGRFGHDGLPKGLCKNGVVGFADGPADSNGFYIFGEALKGLDGVAALCALQEGE